MRYFSVVGQCSAHIAGKLSKIGFKNIEKIKRTENSVDVITKPDEEGKRYCYSVQVLFNGEHKENE